MSEHSLVTTPHSAIRVLVVAEDPLARAGLATLLSGHPGCTVAGQTDGSSSLGEAVAVYSADVVVWDLGWSGGRTLERLADVRDAGVPVVALVSEEGAASEAWVAGARALLPRTAPAETLAAAIVAAASGVVALDPALASALISRSASSPAADASDLTPREREVLRLLAEGLPNKAIAQRLGVTEHTVKFHVNAILGKLGAQSRTEAVVVATRRGLIPL